jgi:two-component system LytT family response regulator
MIPALIVDDEPLARRGVAQMLAHHPDVSVVGEARSAATALRAIQALHPQLVFLDVQMPLLTGFDLLEELGPDGPVIVFVTAYEHFAVRAFATEATDYLLKPLEQVRFALTMERVRSRLQARAVQSRVPPVEPAPAPPDDTRLVIPGAHGMTVLAPGEIDWVEADGYYAALYARGKRFLLRESLSSLEQRLQAAGFLRVHRSALVPVARVVALHRGDESSDAALELVSGTRVPVSRRRVADVSRALRDKAR